MRPYTGNRDSFECRGTHTRGTETVSRKRAGEARAGRAAAGHGEPGWLSVSRYDFPAV